MDPQPVDVNSQRPGHRALPDLGKYVGKEVEIRLRDRKRIVATLRGFDNRMNIVISDWKEVPKKATAEEKASKENLCAEEAVIRGSAIDNIELLLGE